MSTIYLQTTPSLKRHKKVTKAERQRLADHNEQRRKLGLPPVDTLRAKAIDRSMMVTGNKIPDYSRRLKMDKTRTIPSLSHCGASDATARNTMMEQALSGKEKPEVAAEIVRKSKCLAPAFSKGAYQYVGTVDQAQDVGRKK